MSDSLRPPPVQPEPPSAEDESSSSLDASRTSQAAADADRLGELQSQLQAAKEALALAEQSLQRSERKNRVEELLRQARVIDLDAGRLLTESLLSTMSKPDEALAIRQLAISKPQLFHRGPQAAHGGGPAAPRTGALGTRTKAESGGDLEAVAQAAAEGDERALARYLKLRRGH